MLVTCQYCQLQAMESCCEALVTTNQYIYPSCAIGRRIFISLYELNRLKLKRLKKYAQQSKDRTCTFCPQQVLCLTLALQ
jgi:hypothetical protein